MVTALSANTLTNKFIDFKEILLTKPCFQGVLRKLACFDGTNGQQGATTDYELGGGGGCFRVDIADQEKYKAYVAANAKPLKKYGARSQVDHWNHDHADRTCCASANATQGVEHRLYSALPLLRATCA